MTTPYTEIKKELEDAESQLKLTSDWYSDTKNSFFALTDDLVDGIGLAKNEMCFRAIEGLTIPNEWLTTKAHELNKFEFSY